MTKCMFLCLAMTLTATAKPKPPMPPPVPAALAIPLLPVETNRYYFAATAMDNYDQESEFSNEISLPATNAVITVYLAWGRSPSTNTITNYTLYQGVAPGAYTNKVNCGTNLVGSMVVRPRRFNQVITFWATNAPSVSLTNPLRLLFVRAHAWRVSSTKWPTQLEASDSLKGPWYGLYGIVTNTSQPTVRLRVSRRVE